MRTLYHAGGTWGSASLLMQLLIENEHGVEHHSVARDDEWVTGLGLRPEDYSYALTRLQDLGLIDIAVVPVTGEEMRTIRLAKGRFKRYTLTSGDVTTSFWGLVGSKVRCS